MAKCQPRVHIPWECSSAVLQNSAVDLELILWPIFPWRLNRRAPKHNLKVTTAFHRGFRLNKGVLFPSWCLYTWHELSLSSTGTSARHTSPGHVINVSGHLNRMGFIDGCSWKTHQNLSLSQKIFDPLAVPNLPPLRRMNSPDFVC